MYRRLWGIRRPSDKSHPSCAGVSQNRQWTGGPPSSGYIGEVTHDECVRGGCGWAWGGECRGLGPKGGSFFFYFVQRSASEMRGCYWKISLRSGQHTVEGLLFDFNLQFLCETLCERTAYRCSRISWGERKGPSCVLEGEMLSCSFFQKRTVSSFFGQAASVII